MAINVSLDELWNSPAVSMTEAKTRDALLPLTASMSQSDRKIMGEEIAEQNRQTFISKAEDENLPSGADKEAEKSLKELDDLILGRTYNIPQIINPDTGNFFSDSNKPVQPIINPVTGKPLSIEPKVVKTAPIIDDGSAGSGGGYTANGGRPVDSNGMKPLSQSTESGVDSNSEVLQKTIQKVFESCWGATKERQRDIDRHHYSGVDPKLLQPATHEDIQREMESEQRQKETRSEVANKPEKDRKVAYSKDSFTDYTGQVQQMRVMKKCLEYVNRSSLESLSIGDAIKYIRDEVTKAFIDEYGELRIKDIHVRSQQIIVNGSLFMPTFSERFSDLLPLDCYDLLNNGYTARIFDWSCLQRFKNLHIIDIDDISLYNTVIADDLNLSRSIGARSLLRICPSIEIFILGGNDVLQEDESSGVDLKQELAKEKHFTSLFDGINLSLTGGSDKLFDWSAGNLTNYANNRGNKGLIRFTGGLLGRSVVAGAAGVLHVGTHLVRNIFKNIGSIWKDATESV